MYLDAPVRLSLLCNENPGVAEPSPILERVLEEWAAFMLRLSLVNVGRILGFLVEMGDTTEKGQG